MKKIITLTFILLIGLMVLGGCTSTTNNTPQNQQQNQDDVSPKPQKNQQQAESGEIPTPPALPEE